MPQTQNMLSTLNKPKEAARKAFHTAYKNSGATMSKYPRPVQEKNEGQLPWLKSLADKNEAERLKQKPFDYDKKYPTKAEYQRNVMRNASNTNIARARKTNEEIVDLITKYILEDQKLVSEVQKKEETK
jgi:hypothetical protein